VGHNAPMPLQAAKLLASYLSGGREAKDMALMQLKEWLSGPGAAAEPQLLLIAGIIFSHESDYKEALKYTHQSSDMETMSLVAHIYLSMNRTDLARKQVALMQQAEDDATLTKLAGAWVSMAEGADKCSDALADLQELGEKYNMSLLLTNGMALANLHMGEYEAAERLLQDALSKSASDVDSLSNMIVCMHHLRKPQEMINRYVNQLRSVAPTHPWATKLTDLESSFDRCAAQLAAA
jgi:coatomer protein complex subunit epsilon